MLLPQQTAHLGLWKQAPHQLPITLECVVKI